MEKENKTPSTSKPESKPEKENKPKGVLVDADKLDKMLQDFNDMKSKVDRLEYAADKARTEKYDSKKREALPTYMKVRTYNGKIIIGWSEMITNVSEIVNGKQVEDQKVELFYEDGSKEVVDYLTYIRGYKKIEGKVIKDVADAIKGTRIVTILFEDGKEISLPITFIN